MDCFCCSCIKAFLPKTFPRYRLESLYNFDYIFQFYILCIFVFLADCELASV